MKTTLLLLSLALAALLAAQPAAAEIQFLSPWWIATGTTSDTCALGSSVVGLGDINSDSYDDFAVGTNENRVWIFLGSSQPDSVPDLYLNSPDTTSRGFGRGLYNLGDINGDNNQDILVSAYHYLLPNAAKYFVYYTGIAFDTIPDLILGNPLVPHMNKAIGIGDFNGDGGSDFAIVDAMYIIPQLGSGRMQIFYGGEYLDSIPDWSIQVDSGQFQFPLQCAGLGDLNGDGYTEIAAGSEICNGPNGEESAGFVEVFYGGNPPDTLPDWWRYGTQSNDLFGRMVIGMDIDHDGIKELGTSCYGPWPPSYANKILFFNLDTDPDTSWDYLFGNYAALGYGPAVFDFNGDGWEDLVTGMGAAAGSYGAITWLGGNGYDPQVDLIYRVWYFGTNLGTIGNIGDINGDDINDLAVGESDFWTFQNWPGWGRVHVILGNSSFHQSPVSPDNPANQPKSHILLNASPNPFNSEVLLKYALPPSLVNHAVLIIYNLLGKEVMRKSISTETIEQYIWGGTDNQGRLCSAGVYFVKLTAGQFQTIKKIVLLP